MKWAFLVLLLVASPAGAAQFQVSALMPAQDNADTTCTTPQLTPMGTNPALRWVWRWWIAGGDSVGGAVSDSILAVVPGSTQLTPNYSGIPGGALVRFRTWCVDAGGKGCDTLFTFAPFKVRPWRPHKL